MGIIKRDRNEEITIRYVEGETIAKIAESLGITRQRVQQILKRSKVKTRRRGKPRKDRTTVCCKNCKKGFLTINPSRVFCSRKCTYKSLRKYKTREEKAEALKQRKIVSRERSSKYYHEVFKKQTNWRQIVRERNVKNKALLLNRTNVRT